MKVLIAMFSLLLILLIAGLWVGSGSYPELWKINNKITAQEASNDERKEDIKHIQADLIDAQSGHSALEERARSELGMIAEGETFVTVILDKKTPKKTDKLNNKDRKKIINE